MADSQPHTGQLPPQENQAGTLSNSSDAAAAGPSEQSSVPPDPQVEAAPKSSKPTDSNPPSVGDTNPSPESGKARTSAAAHGAEDIEAPKPNPEASAQNELSPPKPPPPPPPRNSDPIQHTTAQVQQPPTTPKRSIRERLHLPLGPAPKTGVPKPGDAAQKQQSHSLPDQTAAKATASQNQDDAAQNSSTPTAKPGPAANSASNKSKAKTPTTVPTIIETPFFEQKKNNALDSVDIVVVYMCGKPDVFSGFSVFEYETLQDESNRIATSGKTPEMLTKKINWLSSEDMLPCILPSSRIIGFGFDLSVLDAKIDFKATAFALFNRLKSKRATGSSPSSNFSSKPIVFIGHGYGTVVIQELLSKYCDGKSTFASTLKTSTAAVFLFAPPFRGSDNLIKWTKDKCKISNADLFFGFGNRNQAPQQSWRDFNSATCAPGDPDTFVVVFLPNTAKDAEKMAKQAKGNDLSIEDLVSDIEYLEITTSDIDQIAQLSGPNDPRFHSITRLLLKAVQTRQLHGAAEKGDEARATLDYLLDRSVDINLKNKLQQTALHVSARSNPVEFINELMGNGVDIDHQDVYGKTALHVVVERNDPNSKPIVEALLQAGADPRAADYDGATPSEVSKRCNEIIRTVFEKPPMVEGPPILAQRKLRLKQPPPGDGAKACEKAQIIATDLFYIKGPETDRNLRPERHVPAYNSVLNLIYSPETNIEDMFKSKRRENDLEQKPFCRWYHVPSNNMAWVEDLFARLDVQIYPWPARYREGEAPHSRCMSPYAGILSPLDSSKDPREAVVILLPYISFEEITRQQIRAKLVNETFEERRKSDYLASLAAIGEEGQNDANQRLGDKGQKGKESELISKDATYSSDQDNEPGTSTSRTSNTADGMTLATRFSDFLNFLEPTILPQPANSPVDMADDKGIELEKDLAFQITGYLTHEPPLHPRRTLDQSYYHMLPDTSERDRDQVVTRWVMRKLEQAKKEVVTASSRGIQVPKHNILMVDQLWLWWIPARNDGEADIVISSFPKREGVRVKGSRAVDDLQAAVLRSRNIHQRTVIEDTTALLARILTVCSSTLDRHQAIKNVEFLHMFQSSIGDAEEEETRLFKEFRRITKILYDLHEDHPKYQKLRGECLKVLLNIRGESNLLKEIKDILDEIKMIKAILNDQLVVLTLPCLKEIGLMERFAEARTLLASIRHSFDVMETHGKDVERGLDHLLELKQMQANLWEARSSREGAEETAKQGNTLMIFTVVTIVFLPLSFMASFFALGVDRFPRDDHGNTNWPLGYVSGLLFGISFGLSILILIIAFNIDWFTTPWGNIQNIWLKKLALWLVIRLKGSRYLTVRTKGFAWYVKLKDALFNFSNSAAGAAEIRLHEREKWREGLQWNIPDSKTQKPEDDKEEKKNKADEYDLDIVPDDKGLWRFSDFFRLYLDDLDDDTTEEEKLKVPMWTDPLPEDLEALKDEITSLVWKRLIMEGTFDRRADFIKLFILS